MSRPNFGTKAGAVLRGREQRPDKKHQLTVRPQRLIIVIGGVGARCFFRRCDLMGVYLSRHGIKNKVRNKK